MSQLRDQFLNNADNHNNGWYPASTGPPQDSPSYPETHYGGQAHFYQEGHGTASTLNVGHRSYDIPSTNRYNSNVSGDLNELYELSGLHKNPFDQSQGSIPPLDPFQNPPAGNIYGYGVVPEPLEAPMGAPQSYQNLPQDDEHLLEKHILRNERNRRKLNNQLPRYHFTKLPWFTIFVTAAQIALFIAELVKMGILAGSPFQTQPYFNPMLGPSTYVLINMGARYVPCMHRILGITLDTSIQFPCPNSTSTDTNVCNLSELCGLGGILIVDGEFAPSQYHRIFLPIFLHAGFIHILFNMLLQLTMGIAVERSIGWLKYGIIYITSGVSGFLLGANFSPNGIASTGASGSLFGVIAANFLLFIYCGKKNTNIYETKRYKTFILIMILEVVVSFVLGLLPGLDNFSHIGGFCMGALVSIVLLPDPSFVFVNGVYTYEPDTPTWKLFVDNWNPLSKYKSKVPWKIAAWACVRIACLSLAIVYFALLTKNLKSKKMQENEETCSWCKYINCIPVHGWCEQGQVTLTTTSNSDSLGQPTSNNNAGTQTTPVEIFNPPRSDISNARRDLFNSDPFNAHRSYRTLGEAAQFVEAELRSDVGSVAVLVVIGLLGYKAAKKLQQKISERRLRKKARKSERLAL